MNKTLYEAQIKLLPIQLIIQNTQIQHTEGADVSQISTSATIHSFTKYIAIHLFPSDVEKIQSYVSEHQINYSKM